MRFEEYITEKITKKEFEEVLKSNNIQGGCEFEFYVDDSDHHNYLYDDFYDRIKMADKECKRAQDTIRDYYNEIEELYGLEKENTDKLDKLTVQYDKFEDAIDRIRKRIKKLEDDLNSGLFKDDEKAISQNEKIIEGLEDKIENLEMEQSKLTKKIDEVKEWLDEYENGVLQDELLNNYEIPNHYSMSDTFDLLSDLAEYINVNGLNNSKTFDEECFEYWERDQDFPRNLDGLLGFDLEDALSEGSWSGDVDESFIENKNFPFDLRNWEVKPDGSLGENGVEVVTPILSISELIDKIEKVFDWIDDNGFTDSSCGFHVHLSTKSKEEIDPIKLILFTEEELIYKFFEERRRNSYALDIKEGHINNFKPFSMEKIKSISKKEKLENHINTQKYLGIHLIELEKNHVEFRYMGGKNYHRKFKDVRQLIINYGHWLSIACDKEYKKKEYIKKFNKLVNYFNASYLKIVIDTTNNKVKELIDQMPELKKEILNISKKLLAPYIKSLNSLPSYDYNTRNKNIQQTAFEESVRIVMLIKKTVLPPSHR